MEYMNKTGKDKAMNGERFVARNVNFKIVEVLRCGVVIEREGCVTVCHNFDSVQEDFLKTF